MTRDGSLNGLKYERHKPGVRIKENSIRYWCSHLDKFKGWQMYVPDFYVKKIETEALVSNVKDRNFIAFDVNYLLSLFKSLNKD